MPSACLPAPQECANGQSRTAREARGPSPQAAPARTWGSCPAWRPAQSAGRTGGRTAGLAGARRERRLSSQAATACNARLLCGRPLWCTREQDTRQKLSDARLASVADHASPCASLGLGQQPPGCSGVWREPGLSALLKGIGAGNPHAAAAAPAVPARRRRLAAAAAASLAAPPLPSAKKRQITKWELHRGQQGRERPGEFKWETPAARRLSGGGRRRSINGRGSQLQGCWGRIRGKGSGRGCYRYYGQAGRGARKQGRAGALTNGKQASKLGGMPPRGMPTAALGGAATALQNGVKSSRGSKLGPAVQARASERRRRRACPLGGSAVRAAQARCRGLPRFRNVAWWCRGAFALGGLEQR